jgi:uncharacterized repeat protein (TIGR01451 family)
VFDGDNAPEPFAGGSAVLNGCYGPTDMSITKSDSPDPVAPGGTLTYHLTVTNNGMPTMPATTSGVTLTDVLPAGVTFVSATPSSGTCSGTSTVTCKLGIFPSGATATVDIVVTAPNAAGTLTNTATVAAATTDPNLSNNTDTEMTTVALVPTSAVSRKIHGAAGTFDVNLPLSGTVGIECRAGGSPTGNHTIVVTFPNPISAVASATCAGNSATTSISSNQVTVNCTAVPNAQTVAINLTGVNDGTSVGNVSIPMGVLLGDVTANKVVSNTDASSVQSQVAAPVTTSNFRNDVTANGVITGTDRATTKGQVGTSLP